MSTENTTSMIYHHEVLPPVPPSSQEEECISDLETETPNQKYEMDLDYHLNNFIPGKFLYIKKQNNREMLVNAWAAITQTNMWDYMKKETHSYSWSNDKEVKIIYDKMEELGYNGHSGCSFGLVMREMQYIARQGEYNYIRNVLSYNNKL
jgi:hypothetical protein